MALRTTWIMVFMDVYEHLLKEKIEYLISLSLDPTTNSKTTNPELISKNFLKNYIVLTKQAKRTDWLKIIENSGLLISKLFLDPESKM